MMKIAVIGCGIAGSSVAIFLADLGCEVTVFEQAKECAPVGAGFILQPSGQEVLKRLGILEQIEGVSERLDYIYAVKENRKNLVKLSYNQLDGSLYGLGVSRGRLFSLLLGECLARNVDIKEGSKVLSVQSLPQGVSLVFDSSKSDEFDLVIVADGAWSRIRQQIFPRQYFKPYKHGAIWAVGDSADISNHLFQVVDGTKRLVGVLPIGEGRASFFWGIENSEKDFIFGDGFEGWRKDAERFCPEARSIIEGIASPEQLTFGTYALARIPRSYHKNIVFIGDAAHPTSPHLGQGLNMALVDSWVLAQSLSSSLDLGEALENYYKERASAVKFYSWISQMLSPFFQSNSKILGIGRDVVLPLMPSLPYVGKEMVKTMSGLKKGWFS